MRPPVAVPVDHLPGSPCVDERGNLHVRDRLAAVFAVAVVSAAVIPHATALGLVVVRLVLAHG